MLAVWKVSHASDTTENYSLPLSLHVTANLQLDKSRKSLTADLRPWFYGNESASTEATRAVFLDVILLHSSNRTQFNRLRVGSVSFLSIPVKKRYRYTSVASAGAQAF